MATPFCLMCLGPTIHKKLSSSVALLRESYLHSSALLPKSASPLRLSFVSAGISLPAASLSLSQASHPSAHSDRRRRYGQASFWQGPVASSGFCCKGVLNSRVLSSAMHTSRQKNTQRQTIEQTQQTQTHTQTHTNKQTDGQTPRQTERSALKGPKHEAWRFRCKPGGSD